KLETLEATADELTTTGAEVRHVHGSVADRATADRAVAEAVEAFGGVHIVVNCAHTYTPHAGLETIPEEDFRKELDTGFFGSVHWRPPRRSKNESPPRSWRRYWRRPRSDTSASPPTSLRSRSSSRATTRTTSPARRSTPTGAGGCSSACAALLRPVAGTRERR